MSCRICNELTQMPDNRTSIGFSGCGDDDPGDRHDLAHLLFRRGGAAIIRRCTRFRIRELCLH